MSDDPWFERVAELTGEGAPEHAPPTLRSKTYSAIVSRMAEAGPLLDLPATRAAGGRLCVFETAVAALPVRTKLHSLNPCTVCHARILGERIDNAPIFWPGCPYSEFHRG